LRGGTISCSKRFFFIPFQSGYKLILLPFYLFILTVSYVCFFLLLFFHFSRRELLPELTAWVRANHPYEVCEVIAVNLDEQGNEPYLKWVRDSTRGAKTEG
jgi:hypothetical protein